MLRRTRGSRALRECDVIPLLPLDTVLDCISAGTYQFTMETIGYDQWNSPNNVGLTAYLAQCELV
jgi:hypothetical protein